MPRHGRSTHLQSVWPSRPLRLRVYWWHSILQTAWSSLGLATSQGRPSTVKIKVPKEWVIAQKVQSNATPECLATQYSEYTVIIAEFYHACSQLIQKSAIQEFFPGVKDGENDGVLMLYTCNLRILTPGVKHAHKFNQASLH